MRHSVWHIFSLYSSVGKPSIICMPVIVLQNCDGMKLSVHASIFESIYRRAPNFQVVSSIHVPPLCQRRSWRRDAFLEGKVRCVKRPVEVDEDGLPNVAHSQIVLASFACQWP